MAQGVEHKNVSARGELRCERKEWDRLVLGTTRVLNTRRIFRRIRILANMYHDTRLSWPRWM